MKKDTLSKRGSGSGAGVSNGVKSVSPKTAATTTERPKSQESLPVKPAREEAGPPKGPVAAHEPSRMPAPPAGNGSPGRVEGRPHAGVRYSPSPERPRKPFVDSYDLPASYGATNLTLIPRDPHWVHAYWEIAPTSLDAVTQRIGGEFERFKHVLRMYDVTSVDFNGSNANQSFDIEVGPRAQNWYVSLWCDNVTYCGELGLRSPQGEFFSLARSNYVSTPRASQSWRREELWLEVKDSVSRPPFAVSKAAAKEEDRRRARLKKDTSAEKIRRVGRRIVLTEDDIRNYYSRLTPLLKDVIAGRLAQPSAPGVKKAGAAEASTRGYRTYHIYLRDGDVLLDNILVRDIPHGQFLRKLLGGSSAELVFPGASESVGGGASEQVPKGEGKKRKFFFEIGTELIVYGRTEPDAEVWLGNKKVPLRADGTFGMRFALPDGTIPLDFNAISNDRVETRRITTGVERFKTKYSP